MTDAAVKPKLASGKNPLCLQDRVFVIPPLAAESPWKIDARYDEIASGRSIYNYFRDYDPYTGRYVQSDPIGLFGGLNTFAYSLNRPVQLSDPLGLNPGVGCLAGSWLGPVGCGVGAAVGTAVMGGLALAAIMATPGDSALPTETPKSDQVCKPAIADAQPKDLCEQLALAEAKAGAGVPIMYGLGDEPRLVALYGPGPWIKMQHTHVCPSGRKVVIHYFTNGRGLNVELKFK